MSEFDIFFSEYEDKHNCFPEKYECYEAGKQSQQSKVDELQKRVDKAIRLLVEAELYQSEPNIDLAVQALKGGEA